MYSYFPTKNQIQIDISGVDQLNGLGGIESLANLLKHNSLITRLSLSDFAIPPEEANHIAKVINSMSIEEITLSCNSLGDEGAKCISEIIRRNSTLLVIRISNNWIRDEGAKWISEAIKENSTLLEIDLLENRIGDDGAKWIFEAIEKNTTLTSISFAKNLMMRKEGIFKIANGIMKNVSLQKIDLSGNEINEKGVKWIAEALKKNFVLLEIDLRRNLISNEGAKWISEAIIQNSILQVIRLGENYIKAEGVKCDQEKLYSAGDRPQRGHL
jgi:Ran GTPase-activating protein (RanGAP) involved in mRNA processing and transport